MLPDPAGAANRLFFSWGYFMAFSGTQHYFMCAKCLLSGHCKPQDSQLNTLNIFLMRSYCPQLKYPRHHQTSPADTWYTHGLWETIIYLLSWQAVRIQAMPNLATFLASPSRWLASHRLQHFRSWRWYKESSTWFPKCKEALLKLSRVLVPLNYFPIGLRWEKGHPQFTWMRVSKTHSVMSPLGNPIPIFFFLLHSLF